MGQRWGHPVFISLSGISPFREFAGNLFCSSAKVTGHLLPWSGNLHFQFLVYCFCLSMVLISWELDDNMYLCSAVQIPSMFRYILPLCRKAVERLKTFPKLGNDLNPV